METKRFIKKIVFDDVEVEQGENMTYKGNKAFRPPTDAPILSKDVAVVPNSVGCIFILASGKSAQQNYKSDELKVDFMRRYYADTGDLNQAITQGGLNRFRPVVMTSLTTIFGLVPMLLPFGDGYAFRLSLAIALMGGMVTSTLLTLYLVPAIFQWVEGRRAMKN